MKNRLNDGADDAKNETYDDDIRYTLQLCHWVLKPIGIRPFIYGHASRLERTISVLLIITCVSVQCFVLLPFGYYTLYYEENMSEKIKSLGPLSFCVTSMIKYGYLGIRGRTFGRCIEHIERDWRILRDRDHRDIMLRNVAVGRNLITMCASFLYTGGLAYHTAMPLLAMRKINESLVIRPLTYPGYDLFFDSQASPAYEIVFFLHCLYVLVMGNITTAAYSLAAIFVTHACGQIEVQMRRLETLVEEETLIKKRGDLGDPLAVIVRNHVEVLRFSKDIAEVLSKICLMEIMSSILLMCLLEYYCMMEWENSDMIAISTYIVLLISFTFNILIFCYVGELLVGQGSKIGSASYDIEWYKLPRRKTLGLILIIAISKYPPKLTAGGIYDLSLTTFANVLRSSVVYMNLLRTITEW